GTNGVEYLPVQTPAADIAYHSAGRLFSAALKADRVDICLTGENNHGQLGDGTTIDKNLFGCSSATTQTTLQLKMFIEGFYMGGGLMRSVLYEYQQSAITDDCDNITLELRNTSSLYSIAYTTTGTIKGNGYGY